MSVVSPSDSPANPPSDRALVPAEPLDPTTAGPSSPTAGRPSDPVGSESAGAGSRPGRSRWWLAAPVAVVAAVAVAFVVLDQADGADDIAAEPVAVNTVAAEQRDLIEFDELDGTLSYADTPTVLARTSGTVTAVTDDGEILTRGDVGFEVDARPVPVFYGTTPLYRELVEGTEGTDVLLLEQNLASLGYHADTDETDVDGAEVDTGFTVDGVFDAATTDAVRRWQADLGVAETGVVAPRDVIVVDGPSLVSSVQVEVGALVQEASPLFDLSITATEESFHTAQPGEIELQVTDGTIADGDVLYVVDDRPVTAVVVDPDGTLGDDLGGVIGLAAGLDRTLSDGVEEGADVEALETMLLALGYDADGDLDVDGDFDDDTADAVTEWQEDLQDVWPDVEVDGTVDGDDLVFVVAGTTVDTVTLDSDEALASGAELFATGRTDTSRIVSTTIPASDPDALIEGQEVEIRFPDGTTGSGVVADVATASVRSQSDPTADPELPVEIEVAEVPPSAAAFTELDVEVLLVDQIVSGATVVPVSALVVAQDGYAVEVVADGQARFVAVEPGMFADGFVEVTGIEPGTVVVVP